MSAVPVPVYLLFLSAKTNINMAIHKTRTPTLIILLTKGTPTYTEHIDETVPKSTIAIIKVKNIALRQLVMYPTSTLICLNLSNYIILHHSIITKIVSIRNLKVEKNKKIQQRKL